jgi:hypothetical protein
MTLTPFLMLIVGAAVLASALSALLEEARRVREEADFQAERVGLQRERGESTRSLRSRVEARILEADRIDAWRDWA